MRKFTAFLSGLLFGSGLLLSGLANPEKVLAFLDLAGGWDPSLALVMGGAIAAALLPMQWARKHDTSLLGAPMQLPTRRDVDRRLVVGALLFGAGWGIAGICPGPSVVLLPGGQWQAWAFFAAMAGGMAVFSILESRRPAHRGHACTTSGRAVAKP